MKTNLRHLLALRFTPGIGDITARRLLEIFPDPAEMFSISQRAFLSMPGTTERLYDLLQQKVNWAAVDAELEYVERTGVSFCCIADEAYPSNLAACYDAPFLLFYEGGLHTAGRRSISIVGSRNATEYGKNATRQLVEAIAGYDPVIISGLAYGIDITAHKAALDHGLTTYAVVAHGLNYVYPSAHKTYSRKIRETGCVVTEFTSLDRPDKENFPRRNRIIAGLADATVVVEASDKGGALITARIAGSYNREVYAFPGRSVDELSAGCNRLIKRNEAVLIESAADLVAAMGWNAPVTQPPPSPPAKRVFADLDPQEQEIVSLLEQNGPMPIDALAIALDFSSSRIATLLLTLEMKGALSCLPGKVYKLN